MNLSPSGELGVDNTIARYLEQAVAAVRKEVDRMTRGGILLMLDDGTRGVRVHTRVLGMQHVVVEAYLHDDVPYGHLEEWTDNYRTHVTSVDMVKAADMLAP